MKIEDAEKALKIAKSINGCYALRVTDYNEYVEYQFDIKRDENDKKK